jgi:NAD(P)-dependent dehydrogenase (short-subunit alcohol dehydrogenase family)
MKRVVFVTGAGSGIGRAIAERLARDSYVVFGGARSKKEGWPPGVHYSPVDVTDEDSVCQAIENIRNQVGSLYGVVNCAGLGMLGAVEDSASQELRDLFETNLIGVHHVCKNTLGLMRKSGGGYIINITSMAAQMGLPYRGIYCASKFAVEGYSEALSMEVAADGIHVVLVEPGDVRTAINSNRRIVSSISERHQATHSAIHRQVNAEVDTGMNPEKIADEVARILRTVRPALRYRVAPAKAKWAYYMMRMLPDRWFEALVRKHYRL